MATVFGIFLTSGPGSCGNDTSKDPRCDKNPPDDMFLGDCDAELGAYYVESTSLCRDPACVFVGGCGCPDMDLETCRQEYIPFETVEECERVCFE